MSNPAQHHKINYIEFYTNDIERTKQFYLHCLWLELQGLGSGLHRLQLAARSPSASRRASRTRGI